MASRFAVWIRTNRKKCNLSQQKLAEKVGVSQSKISTWENGSSKPSKEEIQSLASLFNSEHPVGASEAPGSKHRVKASEASLGEWIRTNREKKDLSQKGLAEKVGVSQPQVSTWENGSSEPSEDMMQRLSSLFGSEPSEGGLEGSFREWLKSRREQLGMSRMELAEKTGINYLTVSFIETGKTESPREATVRNLEKVLGKMPTDVKREIKEERAAGEFDFLGPFPMETWEENVSDGFSCVYALYDDSMRPVRIGQTEDLRRRLGEYNRNYWWCRPPTVGRFAYVVINDSEMRKNIERVMIRLIGDLGIFNDKDKRRTPRPT